MMARAMFILICVYLSVLRKNLSEFVQMLEEYLKMPFCATDETLRFRWPKTFATLANVEQNPFLANVGLGRSRANQRECRHFNTSYLEWKWAKQLCYCWSRNEGTHKNNSWWVSCCGRFSVVALLWVWVFFGCCLPVGLRNVGVGVPYFANNSG